MVASEKTVAAALETARREGDTERMGSTRIICPNGHLGFAPLKVESFHLGVAAKPDFIAADSGSDDVGPVPLGTDTSTSPRQWQEHDLEEMLLAACADDHRLGRRYGHQQPR
jgi:hypothetical protein